MTDKVKHAGQETNLLYQKTVGWNTRELRDSSSSLQ